MKAFSDSPYQWAALTNIQNQTTDAAWSEPVNLSQAGSASQPRLVATHEGSLQAFWWDQFDGLMTAYFDGAEWTAAMFAPIDSDRLQQTPDLLLADSSDTIHAFWLETTIDSTQQETSALLHSQLNTGTTTWSTPIKVAEAVLAFSAAADPVQGINLVYLRPKRSDFASPGIYFNQIFFGLDGWSNAVPIYENIRYRLLTSGEVKVAISQAGNTLLAAWDEPDTRQVLIFESRDDGAVWDLSQSPNLVGQGTQEPRLIPMDQNQAMLIYRNSDEPGCGFYQQIITPNQDDPTTGSSLSESKQILGSLTTCPVSDRLVSNSAGIYWLWGEGSNELRLFAWDVDQKDWSGPSDLRFDFEIPGQESSIFLSDLYGAIDGNHLAVIGIDQATGNVWVTRSEIPPADLINLPPSLWSQNLALPLNHAPAEAPALVIDNHQITHILWSGKPDSRDAGPAGNVLYYSRGSTSLLTTPFPIISESETSSADIRGIASQPALYFDPHSENLHLVWSGGQGPGIFHTQTNTSETISADSWLPLQNLSSTQMGISPQIGADLYGRIYVLYVVPINEGRGVYIVHSDNEGETWSSPMLVFDAEASSWAMVTQPSLAVAPSGTLHVAFVQSTIPEVGESLGVFYSQSTDQGSTWAEPILLAGPGYLWPRLAIAGDQIHLLMNAATSTRIYHRWAVLGEILPNVGWSLWSTISSVPALNARANEYGIASTPSTIYLATAPARNGSPLQRTWDRDAEQWTNPDEKPGSAPSQSDFDLEKPFSVAANSDAGSLSTAWFEPVLSTERDDGAQTKLVFSNRPIPVEPNPQQITENPTYIPEEDIVNPRPVQTQTSIPTPILDQSPPASSTPISPFVLGGVLAGLIVAGVFALLFLLKRNT